MKHLFIIAAIKCHTFITILKPVRWYLFEKIIHACNTDLREYTRKSSQCVMSCKNINQFSKSIIK